MESNPLVEGSFSTYDFENLNPTALLFQTGYLTIDEFDGKKYTLKYPNHEVKMGFLESLWGAYTQTGFENVETEQLLKSLQEEDFEEFFKIMAAIFAEIPYALNSKQNESYFHTVFFLIIKGTGISA